MEITIKEYLEEQIPELKGRLHPLFTTKVGEMSGIYSFMDVEKGHTNVTQLTITILGPDYDDCMETLSKVKEALGKSTSDTFIRYQDLWFYSQLSSGGGSLFNESAQMYELSKYFIINWRKIK